MADLKRFLEHEAMELVQMEKITSDRYLRNAAQLKRKGTPIPTNDIWIAAQTMEHGAELITSNRCFERIDGWFIPFPKYGSRHVLPNLRVRL